MGRKPNPVPNVRRIFTMSPDDALKLKALAESARHSEAQVVRKLIREAAKKL